MKPIKILSLPVDRGGCGWYRVRQPFFMINQFTDSEAHVIDKDKDDMIEVAEALSQAQIVVIRQGGESGIDQLKMVVRKYGEELGKPREMTAKTVIDIDDNVELISPYSEHYRDYGVEEFFDTTLNKMVWKDGVDGFDLIRNRNKVESLKYAMKRSDLVTVTSEKLAEYARQYNKNVAILPNSIDGKKWWKLDFKEHKQMRIGWSGGISHYEDWYAIKAPLNKLLREFRFKLISVGSHFPGIIDEDLRYLVEVWPWVPFEAHSYRMMAMNLDAAIIPLADLPFNTYKSSIKFQEMSTMGVPSLVSNITPYKEDIKPGVTALAYNNDEQFESGLRLLLTDKPLRKAIGKEALKAQKENFDAEKNAHLWTEAYASIL